MSKLVTINIAKDVHKELSLYCAPKPDREKLELKNTAEIAIRQYLQRYREAGQNLKRRKDD